MVTKKEKLKQFVLKSDKKEIEAKHSGRTSGKVFSFEYAISQIKNWCANAN